MKLVTIRQVNVQKFTVFASFPWQLKKAVRVQAAHSMHQCNTNNIAE